MCYSYVLHGEEFVITYSYVLQVKINGSKHTYGSINNCGNIMASNAWVATRAVELLKEKPSMGPKELQDQLKKKYHMEVPYDRVFRGKEKVIHIIYGKWDDSYDILPTYQKLSFSNQCLAVLWSLTPKKNALGDSLLL
jgi:hypothetical protein